MLREWAERSTPHVYARYERLRCPSSRGRGGGGGGDMMDMCCVVTANRRKIAARIAGILHGLFAIAFTLKPPVSAYVFLAG